MDKAPTRNVKKETAEASGTVCPDTQNTTDTKHGSDGVPAVAYAKATATTPVWSPPTTKLCRKVFCKPFLTATTNGYVKGLRAVSCKQRKGV